MSEANNELIQFIASLTEDQIDVLTERLELLRKIAAMGDYEAAFIDSLAEKLFFAQKGGNA